MRALLVAVVMAAVGCGGDDRDRKELSATDITLNGGVAMTRSLAVDLAASPPAGAVAVCFSNTPRCHAWIPLTTSTGWELAPGPDGKRTVYAWTKDAAGHVSPPAVATITYDVTAPEGGRLLAAVSSGEVSLSWTGYSDATGVDRYTLVVGAGDVFPTTCADGLLLYSGTSTEFLHGVSPGTQLNYRLCATDGAGNTDAGSTTTVTTPP